MIEFCDFVTHDKLADGWTIISSRVYDITNYINEHPGGVIIANYLGKDCTKDFMQYHDWVQPMEYLG